MYYNNLREEVRCLKWKYNYSYKEIAEYLEIQPRSLYNWLAGQYEFTHAKEARLEEIIQDLQGGS